MQILAVAEVVAAVKVGQVALPPRLPSALVSTVQ